MLQLFDEIYGVGPATANNWYNKGLRTIADIRKNQHLLNDDQKVKIKVY